MKLVQGSSAGFQVTFIFGCLRRCCTWHQSKAPTITISSAMELCYVRYYAAVPLTPYIFPLFEVAHLIVTNKSLFQFFTFHLVSCSHFTCHLKHKYADFLTDSSVRSTLVRSIFAWCKICVFVHFFAAYEIARLWENRDIWVICLCWLRCKWKPAFFEDIPWSIRNLHGISEGTQGTATHDAHCQSRYSIWCLLKILLLMVHTQCTAAHAPSRCHCSWTLQRSTHIAHAAENDS